MAEPFYWDARKAWFLNVTKPNGTRGRIKLAASKKMAFEKWRAMDSHGTQHPLVALIADEWIGSLKNRAAIGEVTLNFAVCSSRAPCPTTTLKAHQRH